MDFPQDTTKQENLPYSAVAFRRYLADYSLEPLDVALQSGVRYSMVWRIRQGQPISLQNELLIRQGLLRMTGIPYTSPILVFDESEHRTQPLTNR